MNVAKAAGFLLAVNFFAAGAVQAAPVYVNTFPGNECGGQGGFANCYATSNGTQQGSSPGASPSIYKRNSDGSADFGNFASITGTEFAVNYAASTNTLSFTYTATSPDPNIHFFAIFQAGSYALFQDLSTAITAASINLSTYFPNNPGFSHITFFDTGFTPVPPPVTVPEPASMALFGLGLLGMGMVSRRRHAS